MVDAKPPLRAVAPGERRAKAKPKTVTQAAMLGTKRELLVAMRDRIAAAVESANTSPRDLAALTKRLSEVVNDIEAIDAQEQEGGADSKPVEDGDFDASAV